MSIPVDSRAKLKDWIMRRLGWPVIELNLDEDQVEDRIDEAILFFQQFAYGGTERTYLKHQLTQQDIDNQYLTLADNIGGISRIFPVSTSTGRINMFDIRYQLRLQDLQTFTGSGSIVNYWNINTHLRLLDMIFNGETPIRFNRNVNKLYIDWKWTDGPQVGDYIIMEAYVTIDPEANTKMYDDYILKLYAYSLVKMQWGNNLKKYDQVALIGGVKMNGQKIFDEAVQEVANLEQQIRDIWMEPPQMLVG